MARILIADDERAIRMILERALRPRGHDVVCVPDGDRAYEEASTGSYELLLTDIRMPGRTGIELAKQLLEEQPYLPIILMTAHADVESVRMALEVGVSDYLLKPLGMTEVTSRIDGALEKAWLLRENERFRRELTERYKLLVEREHERDALTRLIVEEMSEPVAVLRAGLEMLRVEFGGGTSRDAKEILDAGEESCDRLVETLHNLQGVTLLEKGNRHLADEKIDIIRMIRSEIAALRSDPPVETVLPDELPPVRFDGDLLGRLIRNLFSNATRYAKTSVILSAAVIDDGGAVELTVSDDGEGIPAAFRDSIFEKFGSDVMRQQGVHMRAGLGLAFCRLAASAHGGRIWVDSTPGEGSSFHVLLPVATA